MKRTSKKRAAPVCGPETIDEESVNRWQLDLYVAGKTPKSTIAFENLQKICETHLSGKFLIKVIDIVKNPNVAASDELFAIPMVVRRLPVPIKKIIGDLSNTDRVVRGLEIPTM